MPIIPIIHVPLAKALSTDSFISFRLHIDSVLSTDSFINFRLHINSALSTDSFINFRLHIDSEQLCQLKPFDGNYPHLYNYYILECIMLVNLEECVCETFSSWRRLHERVYFKFGK